MVTSYIAHAMLLEATPSYFGLGVTEPWLAIAPGIAISLAVVVFNLLCDAVRDCLDPRLRK